MGGRHKLEQVGLSFHGFCLGGKVMAGNISNIYILYIYPSVLVCSCKISIFSIVLDDGKEFFLYL